MPDGLSPRHSNSWTVDQLKTYVDALRQADKEAIAAALAAAEKATEKYEREVERWRAASNEWRSAMDDRERRFLTIEVYAAAHEPLIRDVGDLKRTRDQEKGKQMAYTIGLGVIFAVISIALRFV